uniref:Uncharacterized protein n=1 Tax=Cyprinodon variegatus TaxID=28743 RepID=A0A3Q2DM55_CYPVA
MSCCDPLGLCQYQTNKLVRIRSFRLGSLKWSLNGAILLFGLAQCGATQKRKQIIINTRLKLLLKTSVQGRTHEILRSEAGAPIKNQRINKTINQ